MAEVENKMWSHWEGPINRYDNRFTKPYRLKNRDDLKSKKTGAREAGFWTKTSVVVLYAYSTIKLLKDRHDL